jgi:hypothetical protein
MRTKDFILGPPLQTHERVVTDTPMTRAKQTWLIVAAIFGAVALYMLYDSITNPNLDGMNAWDRCAYYAYYSNHGGDVGACRKQAVQEIEARYQ